MATISLRPSAAEATVSRFYVAMAMMFFAIAFAGFVPTFWWKLANGTFAAPALYRIHGALLTCWFIFYLMQTLLAARGRLHAHRMWGMAGIALFSAMCCSILAVMVTAMNMQSLNGHGDSSRQFAAVTFCGLLMMIGLFALAIGRVRRPDVHKRLMLVLMSGMMTPAIARVFLMLMGAGGDGPPPLEMSIAPALIANLPVLAAMVHDRRSIGYIHPTYVHAGAVVLAETILVIPLARTSGWMGFAQWLQGVAG